MWNIDSHMATDVMKRNIYSNVSACSTVVGWPNLGPRRVWFPNNFQATLVHSLTFQELLKVLYTDKDLTNLLDIEFNPGNVIELQLDTLH